MLPAGTSNGAWRSAAATSVTARLKLVNRSGSRMTRSTRSLSPFNLTSATPGIVRNNGAKSVSIRSVSDSRSSVVLDTAILTTDSASLSALIIAKRSTPSGNSRCTRLTASRVSLAASSRLMPGRNSTRTRELPSSLEAFIDLTPDTLATAPSSLLVTSVSTVSGEPPGKLAVTETIGRSTSGSSRTSRPLMAAIPAIIINRLRTTINTGRRMDSDGKSLCTGAFFISPPFAHLLFVRSGRPAGSVRLR